MTDTYTPMLVTSKGNPGSSKKAQKSLLQWHSFGWAPATKRHTHLFSNALSRLNNAVLGSLPNLSWVFLEDRNTTIDEVGWYIHACQAKSPPSITLTRPHIWLSVQRGYEKLKATEGRVHHMGFGIRQTWPGTLTWWLNSYMALYKWLALSEPLFLPL